MLLLALGCIVLALVQRLTHHQLTGMKHGLYEEGSIEERTHKKSEPIGTFAQCLWTVFFLLLAYFVPFFLLNGILDLALPISIVFLVGLVGSLLLKAVVGFVSLVISVN